MQECWTMDDWLIREEGAVWDWDERGTARCPTGKTAVAHIV